MKRIYISGPMTGHDDLNYPAFHAEATRLRATCLDVVNPAEFDFQPGMTWADYMRVDLPQLLSCTGIHLLPGWENSRSARIEYSLANALKFDVTVAEGVRHPQDVRRELLRALHMEANAHVEFYELDAGEGIYHPNDRERALLQDCVTSLIESSDMHDIIELAPLAAVRLGDAERFVQLCGALLADVHGKPMTPAQRSIKQTCERAGYPESLDAFRSMIDAGIAGAPVDERVAA